MLPRAALISVAVKGTEIARRRLNNLHLSQASLTRPADVVRRLGAVQSQDYGPGKWSIAHRSTGLTDRALDQAFNAGEFLRTHVLRPTWHFVAPEDIRAWLAVTGPRVRQRVARRFEELALDAATLRKSDTLLAKTLEREGALTRAAIRDVFEKKGFDASGQRLPWLLTHSELEATICSGELEGKQQTYALLDSRVPSAKEVDVEAATIELVRRYYTSHGPASVNDFAWWSHLRVADIKAALAELGSELASKEIDGITYWYVPNNLPPLARSPVVHLLQAYDEYIVGYRETRVGRDPSGIDRKAWRPSIPTGVVLVNGALAGNWKRTIVKETIEIELYLYSSLTEKEERALQKTAEAYGRFADRAVIPAPTRAANKVTGTARSSE